MPWDKLKAYTRENRKNPTTAENLLWKKLRGIKQGMKFRRQRAIGFFTVDFICVAAKLIIKIDGEIHLTSEQAEYDTGRTFTLTELGYRELRFTNQQVLISLDEVLATTAQSLKENPTGTTARLPLFFGEGIGG